MLILSLSLKMGAFSFYISSTTTRWGDEDELRHEGRKEHQEPEGQDEGGEC